MNKIFKRYPVLTIFIEEEDGDDYYLSYLPDFGWETCSGVGETREESAKSLESTIEDVYEYLMHSGKDFPEPTMIFLEKTDGKIRFE